MHRATDLAQLEVYELLAEGLSNRDIAGVLGISARQLPNSLSNPQPND